MDPSSPQIPESVKIMACIGHVCVQWARLEMALLGIIYTIEELEMEHGELIYGGLDMIPRVNMAVRLAQHHKLPRPLLAKLLNARKKLQGGLCDSRNQIVHGAHREMEGDTTTLTMVRWRGEKRDKTFTAIEIHEIAVEIFDLANEMWFWIDDYGDWKFPGHGHENRFRELMKSDPGSPLKRDKGVYASVQRLWRKLTS